MENGPFEDVFPIKHGDIPASYVVIYRRVVCVLVFKIRLPHFNITTTQRYQSLPPPLPVFLVGDTHMIGLD